MTKETLNENEQNSIIAAEQSTLGSLLINPACLEDVFEIVSPADFLTAAHRTIAEALEALATQSQPIDIVTLAEELSNREQLAAAGGPAYLAELYENTPGAANVRAYARMVADHSHRRQVLAALDETAKSVYAPPIRPVNEIIASAQSTLSDLEKVRDAGQGPQGLDAAAKEVLQDWNALERGEHVPRVHTGWDNVDRRLKGLRGGELMIVAGTTGTGKCFAKDTPILMYSGEIKPVQEVRPGDLLMGPDSQPRRVERLGSGREMMYSVTPTKGDKYIVNESHILSLRMTGNNQRTIGPNGEKYSAGDIANVTVRDYINASKTFKHCAMGWRAGVNFKGESNLPIPPYILGVWLGDGTSRDPEICSVDQEVISAWSEYAESIECKTTRKEYSDRTPVYSISTDRGKKNPLRDHMNALNLLQNKHIPHDYKTASISDRLELLAGLIDTDGYLSCNGWDVVFKQKVLAEDTAFLARSLGLAAYVKKCSKTCTNTGATGTYYRISISGECVRVPCRVERRMAAERRQKKNVLNVGVRVDPVGVGYYYGFEISGNDRLFLLGDFTVVHNTVFAMQLATHNALNNNRALVFSLEMSRRELYRRMVGQVGRIPVWLADSDSAEDRQNFYASHSTALSVAVGKLKGVEMEVDDQGALHINQIAGRARRSHRKSPLSLIVVDYLQLVRGDGQSREREVASVSAGLKALAKELDVPVIALSQFNREAGKGGRPTMAQLRDSGSLEQDADIVTLLYRPDKDSENPVNPGLTEVITAKHRRGEPGIDFLDAKLAHFRMDVWSGEIIPQEEKPKFKQFRG